MTECKHCGKTVIPRPNYPGEWIHLADRDMFCRTQRAEPKEGK